jgi:hypothetical protein
MQHIKPYQQKQKPHNISRALLKDTGYRWVDRDPVMEQICDIINQSGMSIHEICKQVSSISHGHANVSWNTIDNWLNGKTRKPSNWCVDWVAAACGYERIWRRL